MHTKQDLVRLFPNCFQGLGKFQGVPYYIEVYPSVPPRKTPCQPAPFHQQEAFKQQLAEMQAADIIKTIDLATPWINSLVIVNTKTAGPALQTPTSHLDPFNLSQAIAREPFYCRMSDDIYLKLIISPLQTSKGYYHIEFDEASLFLHI